MECGDQGEIGPHSLSTQENVAVVKARLQEEGREARNLIAYSLPLETRKHSSFTNFHTEKLNKGIQTKENKKSSTEVPRIKQEKRHRSASAGRDPQASLRARHWGFLFRNLQQAVDEIYQTAEDDESIIECKEAILMLERYTNDFYKLIEWLKIKWEYENTSPPKRPTFLAWEIRTSSPGKNFKGERRTFLSSEVRKTLNFNQSAPTNSSKLKNKVEETKNVQSVKENGKSPSSSLSVEENLSCISIVEESIKPTSTSPKTVSNVETEIDNSSSINKDVNENMQTSSSDDRAREESEVNLCTKTELHSIIEIKKDESECRPESLASKDVSSPFSPVTPPASNTTPEPQSESSSLYATKLKSSIKQPANKKIALKSESDVPRRESKPGNVGVESMLGTSGEDKAFVKTTVDKSIEKVSDKNQMSCIVNKEEVKCESKDTCRAPAESSQLSKYQSPKPGPQVNMNKASQVRKAFNQSRTPVKNQSRTSWKSYSSSVSEGKSSCTKQQGVGGRLTARRAAEGRSAAPGSGLNSRRAKGSAATTSTNLTQNRGPLERSYTSYPLVKPLVRSATSLETSFSSRGPHKVDLESQAKVKGVFSSEKVPSSSSMASSSNTSSSGQSWADKVKGSFAERRESASEVSVQDDDDEGWEVVRRHRRSHGGSVASLNSQAPRSADGSHSSLQKKGGTPFRMQSRFHQPSSAFSMPSLFSSSSTDNSDPLRLATDSSREEESPRGKQTNSKRCKQNVKKLNLKKKKHNKDCTDGESGGSTDGANRSSGSLAERSNSSRVSNIEKQKKDAANAKTQYESKVSSKGTVSEKGYEDSGDNCYPKQGFTVSNQALGVKEVSKSADESSSEVFITEKSSLVNGGTPADNSESFTKTAKMKNSKSERLTDEDSGSESEREEERMRCNAQEFECVVEREKRLKQQIEEAKRDSIEVEEDDDEDCDVAENCNKRRIQNKDQSTKVENEAFYPSDQTLSRLAGLNWADEMDELEKMDSVRPPGRVLHIHEKLSSPSRKLPISEKLRRHKEKLAKAQELRGKLILAKTEKLKDLFRKIDEVNIDKERLLIEKRDLFERKMERAEEKRRSHLREIVNKAHDEENKAKEIAFINGLEAQNKFLDIMQQHQSHESRLADMAEERSRKQEEKAAKEAAAQERRKALEAERQARMEELCEKRRKRWERIDRKQAERREELLEQAREKARDREERRSALQLAQQVKETELVKKIQQKQEETARRHEENIEQIRQKALESSIMKYSMGSDEAPKLKRYDTKKLCTLCNSVITSEVYLLSHLRGRPHQEALKECHGDISQHHHETYNLNFIIDAPPNVVDTQASKDRERQKALKKRCRKIRTRMNGRGREFLREFTAPPPLCRETPFKSRMAKALTHLGKLLSNQGSGPWLASDVALLDKYLLEFSRILDKGEEAEQMCFHSLGGFQQLFRILGLIVSEKEEESPCVVPVHSLAICAKVALSACRGSRSNCRFLIFSNLAGNVVDYLTRRLSDVLTESIRSGSSSSINTITSLPSDSAAAALSELLSQILRNAKGGSSSSAADLSADKEKEIWPRIQDIVSYCVSMGITDKISWYFNHIQNPVENDSAFAEMILSAMSLLSTLAETLKGRSQPDDPTQLIGTFKVLDACGVVSLLYGLLLHQGGRSPSPPPANLLSPSTLAISAAATTFLHNLAELDLKLFQSVLGSEGISLEFRHIASFLLWYCSHWPCEEILHNIISLVGFFTVNNKENQSIVQSGETPSVLQQLCSLPWQYFSEPKLTSVLFPTLLACCLHNEDNMTILQQEMSFQVLQDYLETNKTNKESLLHILQTIDNNILSELK